MTDVQRITVRWTANDARYIEGLAKGLGIPLVELIRGATIRYAEDYADHVRENGRERNVHMRKPARPHVDVCEALATPEMPAEVVRRRLVTGGVLLDGQPYTKPTIAPRLLPSLSFA